jgi:hypothetical protein
VLSLAGVEGQDPDVRWPSPSGTPPTIALELGLGPLAPVGPIRETDRTAMTIIDLQRRQPGPRADELLDGLQTAIATEERVSRNETGMRG